MIYLESSGTMYNTSVPFILLPIQVGMHVPLQCENVYSVVYVCSSKWIHMTGRRVLCIYNGYFIEYHLLAHKNNTFHVLLIKILPTTRPISKIISFLMRVKYLFMCLLCICPRISFQLLSSSLFLSQHCRYWWPIVEQKNVISIV